MLVRNRHCKPKDNGCQCMLIVSRPPLAPQSTGGLNRDIVGIPSASCNPALVT